LSGSGASSQFIARLATLSQRPVSDPSAKINAARIEGLTAGTWYFTVASYSDTGLESPAVGPVSKTII
jgi:hypothetical protein